MTAAFTDPGDGQADLTNEQADDLQLGSDDPGSAPSWLDHLTDDDAEPDDPTSLALFEGDTGGLTLAQRKALVALLKHRFITAAKHPTEWRVVLDSEDQIRSRLNDLFLELQLDRQRQVAFKRQAVPEGGGRFPTLLHDNAWSREETILLMFLRTRFRSERNEGAADVIVDRDDLLQAVAAFRPAHATDVSGDNRKTDNAIDSLKRTGILVKTNDEHRLLVAPVIEVLLPKDKLDQLLDWFIRHNSPGADTDSEGGYGEGLTLLLDADTVADPTDEETR
jgi:hypothetical protein